MANIDVSIFMLTYNQEDFIAQAIEGVLMQKTNFLYQLVIGEDASTDTTKRICEAYAAANPEKIKLLPSSKNLGLINNFIRTYKECDGKYIAICDGDDYWTDPLKLQKQVDFLEGNPDFSLVFTSFKFLFPDGRIVEKDYSVQADTTDFKVLVFENYICSATALFRNKIKPDDFPQWLEKCPYGDWPLYLWTTRKGEKIKFMNEVTAVYRREIGLSEKMKLVPSRIAMENLNILQQINQDKNFNMKSNHISESLENHHLNFLACLIREAQIIKILIKFFTLYWQYPFKTLKLCAYLFKKKLTLKYIR